MQAFYRPSDTYSLIWRIQRSPYKSGLSFFLAICTTIFLAGCGAQTSGSTLAQTQAPNSASQWQPGDPGIPVEDSCTAGDADLDGLCDDVDPDNSNSDVDNDGEPDGLDFTPQGDGGEPNTFANLSPLAKFGVILAGVMATSFVVNGFLSDNCDVGFLTNYCIESIDYGNSNLSFTEKGSVPGEKVDMRLKNVTGEVSKETWVTFGYNWGEGTLLAEYGYPLVAITDEAKKLSKQQKYTNLFSTPPTDLNFAQPWTFIESGIFPDGQGADRRATRYPAKGDSQGTGACGGGSPFDSSVSKLRGNGALIKFIWNKGEPHEVCVPYDDLSTSTIDFDALGTDIQNPLESTDAHMDFWFGNSSATDLYIEGHEDPVSIPNHWTRQTGPNIPSGSNPSENVSVLSGEVWTPVGGGS